jgi:histone-lysine N-methyltransferase SUV39H
VRWCTPKDPLVPPRAVCSWHDLDELSQALHFIQAYIEDLPPPGSLTTRNSALLEAATESRSLKRKAADAASRDGVTASVSTGGLPTPLASHLSSRSPSVSSLDAPPPKGDEEQQQDWLKITVYNGILQKKEGRIFTKKVSIQKHNLMTLDDTDASLKPKFGKVATINASTLPTEEMREHAAATPGPIAAAERLIRNAFMQKLQKVKGVYLENEVDATTPSLDFTFIDSFVIGNGVYAADPEANVGCQDPCRPDMGGQCGCEYTKLCACLEYAAVDEPRLAKKDPQRYAQYCLERDSGEIVNRDDLPKRFPYSKPRGGSVQTLQSFYLEQRHPIYECHDKCNCGPNCKTRLVSKGRHVDLTIFKTGNRGWGVYCNEPLIKGEFIDVYLGEVLTNEETSKREKNAEAEKASYLYSLDKFVGDDPTLTLQTCYVVDGQYMGNATRFINHSCEPNCRQYSVSHNKYDLRVFNLAFFACEDIPAGAELTFDYMDKDEEEEEDVIRRREAALNDPKNRDVRRCNCGALKCRGYLWDVGGEADSDESDQEGGGGGESDQQG